jgi:SanA protein
MLRVGKRVRVTLLAGFAAAVAALLAVGAINLYVVDSVRAGTSDVASLPRVQVAIVPGAFVLPNGGMSGMLADRVDRAVQLWRAGKVSRILVSGDHGTVKYDEPDTMKAALLADGVPARDIFTDYAGFDTWATMVRARKIFGIRSAIVVTQGFHMPRALFLAKAAGLDAWGLTADLRPYGRQGTYSDLREVLARVKALGQAVFDPSVMGGPSIPISGSGQSSWGPLPPDFHAL